MRIYPGTPLAVRLEAGEDSLRRHLWTRGDGSASLLEPTFYVSAELGHRPAALIRELIGGDERFFPPADDAEGCDEDHNYNDNLGLMERISRGARGAYWDILRR